MAEQWKWASVKRTKEAAEELKATIRATFPDAEFNLSRDPDDPYLWLLWTYADVDDSDEVRDLIKERQLDMLVEEHIPIQVISMGRRSPGDGYGVRATTRTG